jgi:hypothetical protein
VLAIEHGILALKIVLAALINDRPPWVDKSCKKVEVEINSIKEEKEKGENEIKKDGILKNF